MADDERPLLAIARSRVHASTRRGPRNHGLRALGLLTALSVLQGLSWAPFSALPALSAREFGFDDAVLAWQQNGNNIGQAAAMPVAAWSLANRPNGLRSNVRLAAWLQLLQCLCFSSCVLLRTPATLRWVTIVGSVAGGACWALTQSGVSLLSARYFPAESRTKTTAVGYVGTQLGACAGFLWYSAVADTDGLRFALLCQLGAAAVLCFCCGTLFPPVPPTALDTLLASPPTNADPGTETSQAPWTQAPLDVGDEGSAAPRLGFRAGFRLLCSDRSRWRPCALLALIGALAGAAQHVWVRNLAVFFARAGDPTDSAAEHAGVHAAADGGGGGPLSGLTEHDGDLFAFYSMVAYTAAAPIAAAVVDRHFHKKLKRFIGAALLLATAINAALFVLLPSPFTAGLLPVDVTPSAIRWLVCGAAVTTSAAVGAALPPVIELMAEVAHPVSESFTASGLVLLTQFVDFPAVAVIPALPRRAGFQYFQLVVLVTLGLCFAMCLAVQPRYRRTAAL